MPACVEHYYDDGDPDFSAVSVIGAAWPIASHRAAPHAVTQGRSLVAQSGRPMKWVTVVLLLVLLALQYKLWLGHGGVLYLWQQQQHLHALQEENAKLVDRNRVLDAEVRDLKQGFEAIEERARSELGMIKDGETFYLIVDE